MTNSKLKFKDLEFNSDTPNEIAKSNFYNEWPVVYVLNNNKEMYIGETYHSVERMKQHLRNPERRRLKEVHLIGCDDFTKSATLDIESSLIELCSAIPDNYKKLQNVSNGLVKHSYANKVEFSQDSKLFSSLWSRLIDLGLVKGTIEDLKNTDIFKYSPYKSLNAEQCTTRDYIVEDILDALSKRTDRTIFVNGSAGTGKTILAIYLIKLLVTNADYLNDEYESETLPFISDIKKINELKPNLKIGYVVSMTSFRNTLKQVFKSIKGLRANMVISPSEATKNHYDILIVDEAHRLKRRVNLSNGGDYSTFDKINNRLKLGENGNQLDWILKSSQIQILFYDSKQTIKPTDIPKKYFEAMERNKHHHTLSSQMRCNGGRDYINYLDGVLSGNNNITYTDFSSDYDFKLFYNFDEMCIELRKKEFEYGLVRIVSGYGYKWISKKGDKDNPNPRENDPDIVIGKTELFWNRNENCWPMSISGNQIIKEVGCIHTIQGYDLNYCGVIFGPEIDYINGKVVINKDEYFDENGKKNINSEEELKQFIINIYKVLLTRGIKGTYVYAVNEGMRNYLKRYIKIER